MTWSYSNTDLDISTSTGRLNIVRFLVGDTDTTDQQVQNEEITFALSQATNDVYSAAAYIARSLSAKFSRLVDVDLDGQLAESYSQLQKHYSDLAKQMSDQKLEAGGASLGVSAGGLPSPGQTNREFWINQFDFFAQDTDSNSAY